MIERQVSVHLHHPENEEYLSVTEANLCVFEEGDSNMWWNIALSTFSISVPCFINAICFACQGIYNTAVVNAFFGALFLGWSVFCYLASRGAASKVKTLCDQIRSQKSITHDESAEIATLT